MRPRFAAAVFAVFALSAWACGGDTGGRDENDAGGTDGTTPPLPHCSATEGLPGFAEPLPGGHGFLATCGGFSLQVEALTDGIVRLTYLPEGTAAPVRSWAILAQVPPAPVVYLGTTADGRAEVCTPKLVTEVDGNGCRVETRDATGTVLLSDEAAGGFSEGTGTVSGQPAAYEQVVRHTPDGERFYGFGEKTGPLNRRGRQMVFWNTDAYDPTLGGFAPDADPLYASIPFFVGLRTSTAYGVFTDNPRRMEMDMAATEARSYAIRVYGGRVDQYILAGPSMAEVIRRYTGLTGRMSMPPLWTLGYHQCRWGYWPDTRVTDIAQEFRNRSIPADGLWLDIQHMDQFKTFTWDPAGFPDPQGLAASLAADGFRLTVIADPGIKREPGWDVYDSGLAADVFLKTAGGDPFVGQAWPGDAVFPDFTFPGARNWWGEHVGALLELGVRGVWLDVNEPTTFPESGGGSTIPDDVPADGDGVPTTMAEVHNVYALNQARATWEGMTARFPDQRPFILSRAGYASIQSYAAMWTGDAPSTFESLRQTLPMLMNMGLSGLVFVGSDVGGYSGYASAELFARWMAVGSVSPFFRGHVTTGVNDQEPWAFGPEVEDISRDLIGRRYRLLPYLYSLFRQAAATGAPVLRPLVYDFQDDPAVEELDTQAMLGPFVMVAPILQEGATSRVVYLPAGRWFEFDSGAVYDGPSNVTLDVTLAALPTFVRQGAVIPRGPWRSHTGEAPVDPLYLEVYPGLVSSRFTLYEDDGESFAYRDDACYSAVTYTVEQTGTGARLSAGAREGLCPPPARTLEIRVRRVDHPVTAVTLDASALVEHADYQSLSAAGSGYWVDFNDRAVVVSFPDQDSFSLELTFDPSVQDPRPTVQVYVEVTVPAGTPVDPPVHIATSASGWLHQPLEWNATFDTASGWVPVPRGEWFFYKYTRGDWDTVEKWPGCVEGDNRYGFGAAHPVRHDTVATWRDFCPP